MIKFSRSDCLKRQSDLLSDVGARFLIKWLIVTLVLMYYIVSEELTHSNTVSKVSE